MAKATEEELIKVRKEKAEFRAAAVKAGLQFEERYAFDTLWNGLSIRVDKGQLTTEPVA